MTPVPRIALVALAACAVLVSLLLARTSWSLTTEMAVFFGLGGLLTLVAWRFERRLPRAGPEPALTDEVMPGAEGYRDGFEMAGFRRVGGFRWALRGRLVIESVLASAGRDRYAIVTDRVLEVGSRFGDRTLITTNSGRAPTGPDTLRQVVPSASPADLVSAHESALDQLDVRGLRPDRFLDDDDLLRFVRAAEERALRTTKVPGLATLVARELTAGDRDRLLGDDEESRRRINAWLGVEAVADA